MKNWDVSQIDYVARLSRLRLVPAEKEKLAKQLSEIIQYMEKLNGLDTANVVPTAHILPINNVLRQDKTRPSLKKEEVEQIMVAGKDGFFKVPPVLE